MRLAALGFLLMVGLGAVGACGGKGSKPQTLCTPGENIFCRCRGGAAGTKLCKADGQSFESCVGDTGDCSEIVDPATTSSTASSTSSSTSSGGGAGGQGAGDKAFLEPCAKDSDCMSGLCPMGFCTKDCATFKECAADPVFGECIRFDTQMGTVQWCVPYCGTQTDCAPFGMPSECGWAPTLDGMAFAVCADWGSMVPLPPEGTMCMNDPTCNLGLTGAERVCAFNACTAGCYGPTDCPKGKTCSQSGNLGTCQ